METVGSGELGAQAGSTVSRYEQAMFDLAIGKGAVILYDFYALRYPNSTVFHETLADVMGNLDNGIREGESREMRMIRERVVDDVKAYFEYKSLHNQRLIDPEAEVEDRSAMIRDDFNQFGREIGHISGDRLSGESPFERIQAACELAYKTYGLGEYLTDATGKPLAVNEILPSEQVLSEMWDRFVVKSALNCQSLNRFIKLVYENA